MTSILKKQRFLTIEEFWWENTPIETNNQGVADPLHIKLWWIFKSNDRWFRVFLKLIYPSVNKFLREKNRWEEMRNSVKTNTCADKGKLNGAKDLGLYFYKINIFVAINRFLKSLRKIPMTCFGIFDHGVILTVIELISISFHYFM